MSWEDEIKEYARRMREELYRGSFSNNGTGGWYRVGYKDDPVYKQCIADAKEYFKNLDYRHIRIQLPKEAKERIVEFLKSRLEYYNKNGLVISEK